MKLKSVHFINPVSFGGTITSANAQSPSDPMRAGSVPFEIDLHEHGGFPAVKLSKMVNGKHASTYVPLTNVANYSEFPEEAKPAPAPVKAK